MKGSGFCEPHDTARDKRTPRRGYALYRSAKWKAARARQLREHPWCEWPGCHRLAAHVDHVRPLRDGGADLAPSNLQSLCASHHSAKTAREVWHS